MRRLWIGLIAAAALLASACGTDTTDQGQKNQTSVTPSSSSSAPPTSESSAAATPGPSADQALRRAVRSYSDAFLTGDIDAYDLLSKRCRDRTDRNYFLGILIAAKGAYGGALPIRSFDATISTTMARVTYTYDVPAIDQIDEPWVREKGAWHNDDC